jgi:hypothetical protein
MKLAGRILGVMSLVGCRSSVDDLPASSTDTMRAPASPVIEPLAQSGDLGPEGASATGNGLFPGDWCGRLGATDGQALTSVNIVIASYGMAQAMSCETAGLTANMRDDQIENWRQYLRNYTYLMAGCLPRYETVEGGIRAFGPANTPYVGIMRGPLAAAEAHTLTDYYVRAFALGAGLQPAEIEAVRAHLLQAASTEIDAFAERTLSTCAADAGEK